MPLLPRKFLLRAPSRVARRGLERRKKPREGPELLSRTLRIALCLAALRAEGAARGFRLANLRPPRSNEKPADKKKGPPGTLLRERDFLLSSLQDARYVIKSVICDPNFERLVLGCIEANFCK